jgi:peptidyl-prolyl cis-trans isomerase B (cyclophilin B)
MGSRLTTLLSIVLTLSMLAGLPGCPRRGPGPGIQGGSAESFLPADEVLLDIARHEAARDAGAELVPYLRHPEPEVRIAALRALGRMGSDEALEPIAFRLGDKARAVQIAAAGALALGWSWRVEDETDRLLLEDRIEERLRGALDIEDDPDVRGAIARAMGHAGGADAWAPLERMLLDRERAERLAALEGMAMLGRRGIAAPVTSELLDPLLAALVVADPDVQWWSAYVLLRCPLVEDAEVRARAHAGLALALTMPAGDDVKVVLARAVAAVGGAGAVEVLAGLGTAEAPLDVRVAAARALTALSGDGEAHPGATGALVGLCADEHPFVRELAAEGLGQSADVEPAAEALAAMLGDEDPAVRAAAVRGLGTHARDDLVGLMVPMAVDPDVGVRAARAWALARSCDLAATCEVADMLEGESEPLIRLALLESLMDGEHPGGQASLLRALSSESASEAVLGVMGLTEAAKEDATVRASLFEAYDRWEGYAGWEVRQKIIAAVAAGPAIPAGFLDEALLDPERPVREAAARAIRSTGRSVVATPDSMPELPDPRHGVADVTGARIGTDHGTIQLALFPDVAPATVASFVRLAEQGFYDGLLFHRVVPGFVIQGGDPDNTGWGGPGYRLPSELSAIPYEPGTLGMARDQLDTEGSQWFITHDRQPHLTAHYTVFGQVTDGMTTVHAIRQGDAILGVEILRSLPVDEPSE